LLRAVSKRALQEARLAEPARRKKAHVVPAHRVLQELVGLVVAIDDVLGRERAGVDERIDIRDHASNRLLIVSPTDDRPLGNTLGRPGDSRVSVHRTTRARRELPDADAPRGRHRPCRDK
jgi:hypothetical protein